MWVTRVRWIAVLAIVGVMAAACASSGDSDGSGGTAGEDAGAPPAGSYLDQVAAIEEARVNTFAEVQETLSATYTDRSGFFAAVGGIDPEALGEVVETARNLDPPDEHADDHARWIATLETTREAFASIADAVEQDEFVALLTAANRAFIDFGTFIIDSDPAFCQALVESGAGQGYSDGTPCTDPDELPGGEYGPVARRAALRIPAEVFPRIAAPFQAGTDEEMIEYLDAIQPDVERIFDEVRDTLQGLEPPEALAADHEAVLTYLDEISRIAGEISEAATAGEEADLQRLFDESGRPGSELRDTLSEDGLALFRPITIPD